MTGPRTQRAAAGSPPRHPRGPSDCHPKCHELVRFPPGVATRLVPGWHPVALPPPPDRFTGAFRVLGPVERPSHTRHAGTHVRTYVRTRVRSYVRRRGQSRHDTVHKHARAYIRTYTRACDRSSRAARRPNVHPRLRSPIATSAHCAQKHVTHCS